MIQVNEIKGRMKAEGYTQKISRRTGYIVQNIKYEAKKRCIWIRWNWENDNNFKHKKSYGDFFKN